MFNEKTCNMLKLQILLDNLLLLTPVLYIKKEKKRKKKNPMDKWQHNVNLPKLHISAALVFGIAEVLQLR